MQLGTRSLTLNLGGFERATEVSDCRIVAEPVPTERRKLCASPTQYRLRATVVQDPATGSLWDLAWDYVGDKVEVEVRPAGGESPSEAQPWFTGTVEVGEPTGDMIGGQANASPNTRFTFAIDWLFDDKPLRVTS